MGNKSPSPKPVEASHSKARVDSTVVPVVIDSSASEAKDLFQKQVEAFSRPYESEPNKQLGVLQCSKQWPENKIRITLPQVKPPAKKNPVKKTKEPSTNRQNIEDEEIIVEDILQPRSTQIASFEQQNVMQRGKTIPLVSSKENSLFEYSKTKKFRVSRML